VRDRSIKGEDSVGASISPSSKAAPVALSLSEGTVRSGTPSAASLTGPPELAIIRQYDSGGLAAAGDWLL
jgi:hypothetical protein